MGKHASRIDKLIRQVIICLFLVVGIFGLVYSYKCIRAQSIYAKVKYGVTCPLFLKPSITASQELWDLHDIANTIYPHNYYLNSYVAREAIELAKASTNNPNISFEEFNLLARKALFYSKLAVDVNPYDEESRFMYQEALVLNGKIQEAVEYWEKIVDLEYWNRANHVIMAELYLKSNNISLAVGELPHIPNSELKTKLLKYKKLFDRRAKSNNLNK